MSNSNKVPDFLKMSEDIKRDASRMAATESVNFFKESFVKQGFTDVSFKAWEKTKNPLAGKRTLYKGGDLMRNIRTKDATIERVVVISDLDYSEMQNSGGIITVTRQMQKYFWAKYYEFAGKTKTLKSGKKSQEKNSQRNNAKAEFCKRMALLKVGSKIKIPQRQYMGESKALLRQFDEWFTGNVELSFKNHLNNN